MRSRSSSGRAFIASRRSPKPLLTLTPSFSNCGPNSSNTLAKYALTQWPKMMGSETFIMVAFRCREKRMSAFLALANSRSRNLRSSLTDMKVASTTSPAATWTSFMRVTFPSLSTCSMCRVESVSMVTDFSLERKSCSPMVAT